MVSRNPIRPLSQPERRLWRDVYLAVLLQLIAKHDGVAGSGRRASLRAQAVRYANGAVSDLRQAITGGAR